MLKNNYDYIAITSNTSIPSLKTIHLNLFVVCISAVHEKNIYGSFSAISYEWNLLQKCNSEPKGV